MATVDHVASLLYAIIGTLDDFDYLAQRESGVAPEVNSLSKQFYGLWEALNTAIQASRSLPRPEAIDTIACLIRARGRIALAEHDAARAATFEPRETIDAILRQGVRDAEQDCNWELKRIASRLSAMSYLLNEPRVAGSRLSFDPLKGGIVQEVFTSKPFPDEPTLSSFLTSASSETHTRDFTQWAGGPQVTLAIVFTDVVGSTALAEEIKDERMNEVRQAHFARSRQLIQDHHGREIKTIGDSFMAAFRCANDALNYARALHTDTGHQQIRIRAGIHIGPMQVEEADAFGGTVNFAARVVHAIERAEIWLSDRAKTDIDQTGSHQHAGLNWQRHDKIKMKGYSETFTLWSLQN